MIFIEGPRNTGKTFLIEKYLKEFPNNLMTHKFPFYKFNEGLQIPINTEATYFSFGKDLALFALAKDNLLPQNLLLDRGFISSIVFSKIFRNEKEEKLVQYANLIIENYKDLDIDIIYVVPDEIDRTRNKVPIERDKDSIEMVNLTRETILPSTYNMWYGWVLELFKDQPNIKIHKFINHFNEDSVKEFNNLLNSIKRR